MRITRRTANSTFYSTTKRKSTRSPLEVHDLKQQLREVRQASLEATRKGDYMRVAKLTAKAGDLNRAIMEAQGLLQVLG